ncbi:MAG: hypothetical protein IKG25_04735, partial [Mogibacterium sp.]|nr:hypothetical protein [Mogibacterium sp.]
IKRQYKTAFRLPNVHCICQGSDMISSMRVIRSNMFLSQYGAILRAIHTTGNAPAAAIRSSSLRLP